MGCCNGTLIPWNVGYYGGGGCGYLPPACNCPPSPTPPWARESQSPQVDWHYDASIPQLSLDPQMTILSQTQSSGAPINNAMVLPNGSFVKQSKSIYIDSSVLTTTATWTVAGIFAGGFTKLVFNTLGYSALMFWDGTSWQLTGGNAILTP
jgi:hypothetical protein